MKILLGNVLGHFNKHKTDVSTSLILSFAFLIFSFQAGKSIPNVVLEYRSLDRWYEGGMGRVVENMTSRTSNHERVKLHPIFPIATNPIIHTMNKVFGLDPTLAVRVYIASIGFLWMLGLYTLLRMIGCRILDTILFCILAALSAASIFWFTVPETFSFGSLSILLALLIVPISQQYAVSPVIFVSMNVATLGFVITNWMAGILATFATNTFRRAMHIAVYSFVLVVLLWGMQKYIYPDATFFLGNEAETVHLNLLTHRSGGPSQVATSFFYHTLIMPDIKIHNHWYWGAPVMLTQSSPPGSASIWGKGSVAIWTVLLLIGICSLLLTKEHLRLRIVLGLLLMGQLALHIAYGAETFLYSLHFIILLIPLAALGTLTKYRKLIIVLMIFLIPCVTVNNLAQFDKSKSFLRQHVNPKEDDARYRK